MSETKELKNEIQELTELVHEGFETMSKGFETMNRGFETMHKGFETMNRRFEEVDRRFEEVDKRFDAVDQRIDDLKEDMDLEFKAVRIEMDHGYKQLNNKIDGVDRRVGNLESAFRERWNVPELTEEVKTVVQVVGKHSEKIRRIEDTLVSPASYISVVTPKVSLPMIFFNMSYTASSSGVDGSTFSAVLTFGSGSARLLTFWF